MAAKRVFLLKNKMPFYKANLHCHSTVSDGKFSPEELKRLYKEKGYHILALTDHEVLVPHDHLNDDAFLTLPGYELQTFGDKHLPKLMRRVNHMNFYPIDPHNTTQPFFNLADVMQLDTPPDVSGVKHRGEIEKEYSVEGLNKLIRLGREAGFIVSLNHPTWSKEDAGVYTNLEGLFAVEIYNHGCHQAGYDCYCPYVYEEMLRSGQRIGCMATDDTHHAGDLFGGFTMIAAPELSHAAVIKALEQGDFYASRGPEIKELWYESGNFHIACSAAAEIVLSNSGRRKPANSVRSDPKGEMTSADFPLDDNDLYVRFTVTDAQGRTANTRAYWREEFEERPAAIPNICNRKIGG